MPFVSGDHFMDMLFDGATPGTTAPTHTIYGSMAMTPAQNVDISGGKAVHLTMEVDGHQSFRRWLAFDLAPASDPLQAWDTNGHPINNADQGSAPRNQGWSMHAGHLQWSDSATDPSPTGTAAVVPTAPACGVALVQLAEHQSCAVGTRCITQLTLARTGWGTTIGRGRFLITQDHAALF